MREESREDEGWGWVGRVIGLQSADSDGNLNSVHFVKDLRYTHGLSRAPDLQDCVRQK